MSEQTTGGSASGETLWQRRRRLVSLEIERIAIAEFVASGYENVTIEQIATAAGTTVRTFYRYFASKEDVLWAMPRRVSERLGEAVRARPPGEPILDSFRFAITAGLDADAEDERISLKLGAILRSDDEGALPRARGTPGLENMVSVIADRMGLDAERDFAPRVLGEAIGAAIMVALRRWSAMGGRESRARILIEALDVLETVGAAKAVDRPDQARAGDRPVAKAPTRRPRALSGRR